jgi:glycosyltransferase involved in cell wall biosynthesis
MKNKIAVGIIGFGALNPIVGLSQHIRKVIQQLPKSLEVTLYSLYDDGIHELDKLKNLEIISIRRRGKTLLEKVLTTPFYWFKLFFELMKRKHNVLIVTGEIEFYQALLYKISKENKVKLILNFAHATGGLTFSNQVKSRKILGIITSFLFFNLIKISDAVITHSKTFKKIINLHFKVPFKKIYVVYNAPIIPTRKSQQRKKLHFEFNKPIIYTGMAKPEHNLELIIKALPIIREKYPTTTFLISGRTDQKYFKSLLDLADKLKVRDAVHYLGVLPEDCLEDVYKISDVTVFVPTEPYGWSLTLMRSMLYKVPCVALDSGALRELIQRYDGILVPNDPGVLAREIIKLFENKEIKNKIVQNAYKKLKKDTWEKCAQVYVKCIHNVLKG